MELEPFHVTRSPASERSCKASGTDPEHGACSAFVWMKTKRLRRSTRVAWMALKRPDSRQGSDEVGTKTTVRLCSMQSNTALAAAAKAQNGPEFQETFVNADLDVAHTCPRQDVSVIQAEAVAKSFFQNTLQKTFVQFIQSRVCVALVAHQKRIVGLSV